MRKNRPVLFFITVCLCFLAVLALLFRLETKPPSVPDVTFSVVVYGTNEERWRSFNQGVQQACDELGISRAPVIPIDDKTAEEQIELLQREVENGTQGLVIAAANSGQMEEYLSHTAQTLAVVLVETGAGEYKALSADDAGMGRELADNVAQDGCSKLLLVATNLERQSVQQRYDSFMQRAEELDLQVTVWNPESTPINLITTTTKFAQTNPDAIIALDNEATEAVAVAMENDKETNVYGVGSSDQVIAALDHEIVDGVCFPNEFNMGYLSTMELADKMGLDAPVLNQFIEYKFVTKQNLYEPEIERLVFPLIQ